MNKRESLFMLTVLFWITNFDYARTAVSDDYDDYVPDVEEDANVDDAECKLGEFRFDLKSGPVVIAIKCEEGGVIELQCRACGAESFLMHIEWLKDNLPPREWTATNGREFIDKEYKLRINECGANDTGNYTCVIDDQSNMRRLSRTYEVIVKIPWYSQYWFYFILVSILVIVVSLVVAAFFRYQKVKNSRKYSPENEMINTTRRTQA